tara:strand:- start:131 stop:340 length:210 start_codon:yes stop_codon:yes gene_type:complete
MLTDFMVLALQQVYHKRTQYGVICRPEKGSGRQSGAVNKATSELTLNLSELAQFKAISFFNYRNGFCTN